MNSITTKITLLVNRLLMCVMAALLFGLPRLLDWYITLRPNLPHSASLAILISFYCCAPAVALALWDLDTLLRNILGREIFIVPNVRSIRRVRWCCLAVSVISLAGAWFYPPLIFMFIIMFFLTLILSVLGSVMAAAVEIREENDLTV